jgi:hypothetical protein
MQSVTVRSRVWVGVLVVLVAALSACGGKSDANGGTATGGVSGIGGSGATGATGGTVSAETCTSENGTLYVNGVRYRCAARTWVPVNECMMGSVVGACCGGASPMKSADVATDPCLLPFPDVSGTADGCATMPDCSGTQCGMLDTPIPRTAELGPDGQCVAVDECETAADCVIAVNSASCCSCPEAFPKRMLEQEPCITTHVGAPSAACADCSAYDCPPCATTMDAQPHCVANAAGIRSCTIVNGCQAQDAAGLDPDPPTPIYGCIGTAYRWNGTACVKFSGCWCSGADCGAIFATPEECLLAYQACGAICFPGMDQTCNDSSLMSSIAGHCEANGTCTCGPGRTLQPSGRCL